MAQFVSVSCELIKNYLVLLLQCGPCYSIQALLIHNNIRPVFFILATSLGGSTSSSNNLSSQIFQNIGVNSKVNIVE